MSGALKLMRQDKKAKLPKCWYCGKSAELVYENEYWTYWFDEKTGKYERELCDIEIRCPHCGVKLSKEFPDGVCSFTVTWQLMCKQCLVEYELLLQLVCNYVKLITR